MMSCISDRVTNDIFPFLSESHNFDEAIELN